MAQAYGLGRGLSSLIPKKSSGKNDDDNFQVRKLGWDDAENIATEKQGMEVDVENIMPNPHQPRVYFDPEKLEELSQSIKKHGVLQPLVVTKKGDAFELVAGERRLQASKMAGLKKVPVIVKNISEGDKLELAVVENIQRHDLNPIEEAKAYEKISRQFDLSQEEVARRLGKSRSLIANKIRLLNLPIEAQKALIGEQITEGHAKVILALDNPEKQRALLEMILKSRLTVRQTEEKVQEVSVRRHQRRINVDPQLKELEDKLTAFLGTKVRLKKNEDQSGKIIIDFYSGEDLENILGKIS